MPSSGVYSVNSVPCAERCEKIPNSLCIKGARLWVEKERQAIARQTTSFVPQTMIKPHVQHFTLPRSLGLISINHEASTPSRALVVWPSYHARIDLL